MSTLKLGSYDPLVLLDPSTPFDDYKVAVLDQVVNAMFGNVDSQSRDVAHKVLGEFKNMPNAWRHVAIILANSVESNTKFFALQILESCIQTQWNILPENERSAIKQYVSEMTLQLASNEQVCQNEKHFLNKVNENLIQIVKKEWPDRWPNFITEVCKSSRSNQAICENNMKLFNLLSEEVFDFGREHMTSKNVDKMMNKMTVQFQEVFDLCLFILQSSIQNPSAIKDSLVKQTLQCLSHFLKWIPFGFIFETSIIDILLTYFWDSHSFRIECVKCLCEVANIQIEGSETQKLMLFWTKLVEKLDALPHNTIHYEDSNNVMAQMRLFWETFYSQLAICLSAFLKNHRKTICENDLNFDRLKIAFCWMIRMSQIYHDETFKICLDYWQSFCESLISEIHNDKNSKNCSLTPLLQSGNPNENLIISSWSVKDRLAVYNAYLNDVRRVMIDRMAKPQEVYIQLDEETGDVSREYQTDTDEVALYNQMRTTQRLLTALDQKATEQIMLEVLNSCSQNMHSNDSWNSVLLNRLCYSIGSISGTMNSALEKQFLVTVIRTLLVFCEMRRGKESKAIVASCIMYVVGQYPSFLSLSRAFLKAVINKLFDFMHETFPGVQEMACETFLKVSKNCARSMATPAEQGDKPEIFLIWILEMQEQQAESLEEKQHLLFLEAISHIIAAAPVENKPQYIATSLMQPTQKWMEVMQNLYQNPEGVLEVSSIRVILRYIRQNQQFAKVNATAYTGHFKQILQNLLDTYWLLCERIRHDVATSGLSRFQHSDIRLFSTCNRETLKLVEMFIEKATSEGQLTKEQIVNEFRETLLLPILKEYGRQQAVPPDYEVLRFLTVIVTSLNNQITSTLPMIFTYIFHPTLELIKRDFHSYPDHREHFYAFLKCCTTYCYSGLFELPSDVLRAFVESLVWAFKHELPSLADHGLQITNEFLQKLIKEKREALDDFCTLFYWNLLQEILTVLTDRLHCSGFQYQTSILMYLIWIIEFRLVDKPEQGLNKQGVMIYLKEIICRSFVTVNAKQVETFVLDLFYFCATQVPLKFQTHVRDFLISIREFAGNNSKLFDQEFEEAYKRMEELESTKNCGETTGAIPAINAQDFEDA